MYTAAPLFIHLVVLTIGFFTYYYMSAMKCFRKLLWKFPGFFTLGYMNHQGPTEEMSRNTKFAISFTGKGTNVKGVFKTLTIKVI